MGEEEKLPSEVEVEDEEGQEVKEAPPSTDTSRIVKILLWAVGAVLVASSMFGISWLVANYVQGKKEYQREQDVVVAPPPPPLSHFDFQQAFSITTSDLEPHFGKISISLGYDDSIELNSELIKRTVELQHVINILLSSKKFEDMDSVEEKIGLSEEIKSHVNVLLIAGKIKEVYFKEFIVN